MKKKRCGKIIRNTVLALFLLCVCAAGALALRGYSLYTSALAAKPVSKAVKEVREQPGFTPLASLPETYPQAVLAVEDHRFYEHGGVDFKAIARAALHDLQAMSLVEGGSTITQQLAKNLYFTQEKELTRKAAEVFMAWKLENDFSKEELLELYVNSIYFGSGCYSVGDASRTYFDKEPGDMSDWECTLLAGIPNAPSVYDLNVNPDLAQQRQRQVVELMVERGKLTQHHADAILGDTGEDSGILLLAS